MIMNAPVLSPEEIKRIHNDSIRILEEVGVKVPSDQALDILEAGGAKIDRDSQVAYITADMVDKALKQLLKNSFLVRETENTICGCLLQELSSIWTDAAQMS